MSDRREFLKMLPLAAIAPKMVKEGILSVELPHNAHLIFLIDERYVDIDSLETFAASGNAMPPGSTGGAILFCKGNPDEIVKIYKVDDK